MFDYVSIVNLDAIWVTLTKTNEYDMIKYWQFFK